MRPAIITGGIGTGKSTVCAKLALKGVKIIDADAIAHKVLDEKAHRIGELFGKDCVVDGRVNRKILGEIVFSDPLKREVLEELIHPIVRKRLFDKWEIHLKNKEDAILDIPLYFESKQRYDGFFIVVVYASQQQQKERLAKRDGLDDMAIQKRLDAQWPIEKKRQNAHWVVDNSGDLNALEIQIQSLYKWLKEE
jgi:dephospho-CoA kinase